MVIIIQWRKYLEKRYQIQLSSYAKDDIEDIYNYIKKDSIYYAIKTKR